MSTELNSGTVGGFGHMGPNDPYNDGHSGSGSSGGSFNGGGNGGMIIVVVHLILHPLVSSLLLTPDNCPRYEEY